jgi:hypothetical protein
MEKFVEDISGELLNVSMKLVWTRFIQPYRHKLLKKDHFGVRRPGGALLHQVLPLRHPALCNIVECDI